MKQALWHPLEDFLSTILFLIAHAASGSVRTAAGVGVAAGLVQFGRLYFAARRIDLMQWSSLALAMVLGGAAILTRNPRFVMVKPSIVHLAIAAAMLRRGWMIRYVTPIARQNVPETTMVAAGYAWAMLMAALGFAQAGHRYVFRFRNLGLVCRGRCRRRQAGRSRDANSPFFGRSCAAGSPSRQSSDYRRPNRPASANPRVKPPAVRRPSRKARARRLSWANPWRQPPSTPLNP
jgi:intracellular septation protein A